MQRRITCKKYPMHPEVMESPLGYHSIWEHRKYYLFFALGGALVGGLSVFIGMTFFDTVQPIGTPSVWSATLAAVNRLIEKAESFTRILESIDAHKGSKKYFEPVGMMSNYQQCLKDCAKSFPAVEEADKGLLINCRRECMAKFSNRAPKMRQKTEEDTP